jgi:hypothetical protein
MHCPELRLRQPLTSHDIGSISARPCLLVWKHGYPKIWATETLHDSFKKLNQSTFITWSDEFFRPRHLLFLKETT